MVTDGQLLDSIPDFLSIESMLKATPAQEGAQRFVYLEASKEARDYQSEVVLAKALEESAGHFLKFGNLDIDHFSMPSVAKNHGIEQPELWEIGVPVDVRFDGGATFVKARLFSGDTPLAAKANMVWDSMTKLNPPKRWYPSVGGAVLAKSIRIDKDTGDKVGIVSKVRWSNLAISAQPVNPNVGGVATVPFGALAKSWGADGFAFSKSMTAGHETDVAGMHGGSALRVQSLDGAPHSYFDFRNKLAGALRKGSVSKQSAAGLVQYCIGNFSLEPDEATEWVDRFLGDLKTGLTNRSNK